MLKSKATIRKIYAERRPTKERRTAEVLVKTPADQARILLQASGQGGVCIRQTVRPGTVTIPLAMVWLQKGISTCDLIAAMSKAQQMTGYLGLIYKGNRVALRFEEDHLEEARETFCQHDDRFIAANRKVVGKDIYLVNGIPEGVDAKQLAEKLAQWADGWPVIPVKSYPTQKSQRGAPDM